MVLALGDRLVYERNFTIRRSGFAGPLVPFELPAHDHIDIVLRMHISSRYPPPTTVAINRDNGIEAFTQAS